MIMSNTIIDLCQAATPNHKIAMIGTVEIVIQNRRSSFIDDNFTRDGNVCSSKNAKPLQIFPYSET